MKKQFLVIIKILILCLMVFSCKNEDDNSSDEYSVVDCPKEIKNRAYSFSEDYDKADTEWAWGGQNPVRSLKVDCSGLVIMCYKYAMVDTKYKLLLPDMTSAYMYDNAVTKTTNPEKGDIIFFGENGRVNHCGFFDKFDGDFVWIMDSSEKGKGVSHRSINKNDASIMGYGVMKLKKYKETL